jgi:putative transposase
MPRIPRSDLAATVHHVLNRGIARATIFHKDADYRALINLFALAKHRFSVKSFALCVMPNHFHAVLQSDDVSTLSRFMQWWLTTHVRRYHRHYRSSGHVWQGRFKGFPVQKDAHLLTVIRYVLRNPVRAQLVQHPAEWPWSSLHHPELTDDWPFPRPHDWNETLTQPLTDAEIELLRRSVNQQAPFGDPQWTFHVGNAGGLASNTRPRARPRKSR